jgi:hypothetical protein
MREIYRHDLHVLLQVDGCVPIDRRTWTGDTLVPFALDIAAESLGRIAAKSLGRVRIEIADDGAVLIGAGDGRLAALHCFDSENIRVFATPLRGKTYFIFMSSGLLKSLLELIVCLFAQPGVMSAYGDIGKLLKDDPQSPIPPGFEAAVLRVAERVAEEASNLAPENVDLRKLRRLREQLSTLPDGWTPESSAAVLGARLSRMCPIRQKLFQFALHGAIDFAWLHELGHVLCGHLDLPSTFRRMLLLDEAAIMNVDEVGQNGQNVGWSNYLLEMEADAWAHSNSVKDNIAVSSMIGVSALFFLLQGKRRLEECVIIPLASGTLPVPTHPPIWYRGSRILKGIARPALRESVVDQFEVLAGIHVMFGEWFNPLARGQWELASENFERDVKDHTEALTAELAKHRRQL